MTDSPSTPENIANISELLTLSKSQYRIYDLGRKIDKISKADFSQIELNQRPYPFPSQGHGFIAIAFWQNKSSAPYIWFLKLPLDERGLLNQGARNHFIAIIIEALGADLTIDPTEKQEELLKNNPYHFTPTNYKLAALNSKIKLELKQQPSEYLAECTAYIAGDLGWNSWQNIGVQGVCDYAIRINEGDRSEKLIKALPHIAPEVLMPLCSALENEQLSVDLIDAIISEFTQSKNRPDEIQQNLLRSLASSCQHPHVINFVEKLLEQPGITKDLLIILSGRCWLLWQEPKSLLTYFEVLASKNDQPLFVALFKDLVAIPAIRPIVLQCMRNPDRSESLAKVIGSLFQR